MSDTQANLIQRILDREISTKDYLEIMDVLKVVAEKMKDEIKDPRHRR